MTKFIHATRIRIRCQSLVGFVTVFCLVHIMSHFFQGNLWHQILQTGSARLLMSQWLPKMVCHCFALNDLRNGLQGKYTITCFSGNGQRMRTNIVAIGTRPSFFILTAWGRGYIKVNILHFEFGCVRLCA